MSAKNKAQIVAIAALIILMVVAGVFIGNSYQEHLSEKESLYAVERAEETEKVTLHVTFVSFEKPWNMIMEEIIEDFEKENKNIDVEYEIISETGLYEDAINKLYARDELGDIVELTEPLTYVINGLLYPLPEEVSSLSNYTFRFAYQTYGIGTVGYTTGVIYNKKIFEEYDLSVPETYEDLLNICETLKENGIIPLAVGGANRWSLSYFMNYFFKADVERDSESWMEGLHPENNTSSWNDPEISNLISDMTYLFEEGYVNENWSNTTADMAANLVAEGSAAMIFGPASTIKDIQYRNSVFDTGWFYLPDEDGNEIINYQSHGYFAMTESCAADENTKEAAIKFLQYFYSEGIYEKVCNAVIGIPFTNRKVSLPYSTIREEVYPKEVSTTSVYNQDLTNATLPQDFRSYLFLAVKDALMGNTTPEETAENLLNKWNEIQGEHVYEEHDFN